MAAAVAGLFDTFDDARKTLEDLESNGFSRGEVSCIASDPDRIYAREFDARDVEEAADLSKDTVDGAVQGAALGGAIGFLAGLTALVIPVFGPVITIGSMWAGVSVGAAAGGVMGALSNYDLPEEQAGLFAEGLRRGGAIVVVETSNEDAAYLARKIMERHNVVEMSTCATREADAAESEASRKAA